MTKQVLPTILRESQQNI